MCADVSVAAFAACFAALYAAHMVADHWVQTCHQAAAKAEPGWYGRLAGARHVAAHTAVCAAALLLTWRLVALPLHPLTFAAGLGLNAVSHWWADRRHTLRALARLLGQEGFYSLGAPRPDHDDNPTLGTGAYALDQSWHIGWLFLTALVIAQ